MSIHHIEDQETLHLHEPTCGNDLCHPHDPPAPAAPFSSFIVTRERRNLFWAIVLTAAVMMVEVVGGIASNSLSFLSDAGHMLSDVLALSISFLALVFSSRRPTSKNTFGFYRLEILAALLNSFLLFLVTLWIFYKAYQRFYHPVPVASVEMMAVAAIGLVTNLGTMFLLRRSKQNNINIKSAFLHMIGDTLSSVGVLAGAGVIYFTLWWFIAPLLGVLLSFFILFSAFRLMTESIDILLEATPKEIDPVRVVEAGKVIEEVRDVHDVHVWTLTSGKYALSAHVAVRDMPLKETADLLRQINVLLCQRFKIGHAAIQLETEESAAPSSRG